MQIRWTAPLCGELARRFAVGVALSLCSSMIGGARAHEADKPKVLVFAARAREAKAHKGETAVTRDVRAALERLELAELLPAPALDLEAMQLTLDCVGETAGCLGEVAEQSHARYLLVPMVERGGGNTTVRILYYDAESGGEPKSVSRSEKGRELDNKLLDAIPDMLRELFPAEPEPEVAPEPEPEPAPVETEPVDVLPEPAPRRPFPVGPVILGAVGLGAVGGGVALGLMMKSTEDSYAGRKVQTAAQAKRADDERKTGQRQALMANVLIGAGAAALVGSVIWFVASGPAEAKPAPQAMLVPSVSTDAAGLVLVGNWGDRL
jgi:hypothetical protein